MSESPKNHLKSHQFEPYSKVRGYILTMQKNRGNKQYKIFDQSYLLNEKFKSKTPDLNLTSTSPISPLSKELNYKMKLVEAYHNLRKLKKRSKEDFKILNEGRIKSPKFRYFTPTKYNYSITKLVNTSKCQNNGLFLTENIVINTPKIRKNKKLFMEASEKRYFRIKEHVSTERNLDFWPKILKKLELSFDNPKSLNDSNGLSISKYCADTTQSQRKQEIKKKEFNRSTKAPKS